MNIKIIVALISLSGVVISSILSFIISKFHYKIELDKIQNNFREHLYIKRLDAYLLIYELISGFVHDIRNKLITYDDLNAFYGKYIILDSKYGLLFSYALNPSYILIRVIKTTLNNKKDNDTISKKIKIKIVKKIRDVEISMKNELGIILYKNPLEIMKNYKLLNTYREINKNVKTCRK